MAQQEDWVGSASSSADWFSTTQWSVVLAAREGECPAARQALESLCQAYWYPLYVYVRRRGYSAEDAQDLTQGFFESVIRKNYFARAERECGRFRAFLLVALKHFLSDQRDRQRAAKRGGGMQPLSLETAAAEARYLLEPVDSVTPEKLYDRRWALTVLVQARTRLRQEFTEAGKLEFYQQLTTVEAGGNDGLTYAEIGRLWGMSESAVKSAALRLRGRYGQLVRHEIAQTVASVAEIDQEIRDLLGIISE